MCARMVSLSLANCPMFDTLPRCTKHRSVCVRERRINGLARDGGKGREYLILNISIDIHFLKTKILVLPTVPKTICTYMVIEDSIRLLTTIALVK